MSLNEQIAQGQGALCCWSVLFIPYINFPDSVFTSFFVVFRFFSHSFFFSPYWRAPPLGGLPWVPSIFRDALKKTVCCMVQVVCTGRVD